jgi:hypothetical protein
MTLSGVDNDAEDPIVEQFQAINSPARAKANQQQHAEILNHCAFI